MLHPAITALQGTLRPHLELSKDRLETLAFLVVAIISARTVNLSHLAAERPGTTTSVLSTYRRLQRFFQHVRLGRDRAAPLVAELAGLRGSWHLALDRTQWAIGSREINFLVLAAVTPRLRVPLLLERARRSRQQRYRRSGCALAALSQGLQRRDDPVPARRPGVHRLRVD